jgi:vitamin B12/bleomycin/antimicrobial peptide transport system ATP-binding/permease protein
MRRILNAIWRLLRMAAGGPFRWAGFALLAFIIGCQIASIQITLRLTQWSADFYNALQRLDAPAAVTQVGIFAVLIGTSAGLYLVGSFARQHLQIRWRRRLTDAVLDKWLPAKAYWFLQPSLGGASIDNPDQRIAEDCREFVESILTKVLDFLMSLIGLVSFVTLLWQLSTFPLSFELFGIAFEIPRYMVWAAPIYVAIATGLTHALGRQMPGLLAEQQKREADFRFALMRLRENAAAVALSGGELSERRVLDHRFQALVGNWRRVIAREFIYGLFQRPYFQTVLRIPMFIALPAFLAGKVTLGGLMQVASAFQNVVTTLSWFVFNYKFVSDLVATTKRIQRFLDEIDSVGGLERPLARTRSSDGVLRMHGVSIFTPDKRPLLRIGDLAINKGDTVWLSGASGLGKSTLLKALAGLWTFSEGRIELPDGHLCFMPQQVYMPLAPLVAAAAYPSEPDSVAPGAIEGLLRKTGLGHRLDAGNENAADLSVGEQQRLALVRLILARPDWAFLDEATSALDLETEKQVMSLLRAELPDTTFVIVAHREPQGLGSVRNIPLGVGLCSPADTAASGYLVRA